MGRTTNAAVAPAVVGAALPRATPAQRGIPAAAITRFLDALERETPHPHGFMLLRRGAVVAEGWWEPYGPATPHMLFSLSKSFTSTAIGLLVAEGRLSVEDTVLSFFPENAPDDPSAHLRALTVRHLLTMNTGHETDPSERVFGRREERDRRDRSATPRVSWVGAFLSLPIERAPGTHFVYNTAATYMLSAIAQRITGERLLDYLKPRLFEPLGIGGPEHPTWEQSPEGVDVGGFGLNVTTEDVARFGQLYLQRGMWGGRRILPASWVDEATARQVPNGPSANPDWVQGYGYQFWRCRHGAYRGDGAFGQFCVVMPAQETVLAITSGVRNMQAVLELVWAHLLPVLPREPEDPAVPAVSAAPATSPDEVADQETLSRRLASLALEKPQGRPNSTTAALVSGKTFTIAENDERIESIAFDFGAPSGAAGGPAGQDNCAITIRNDRGLHTIGCGDDRWSRGRAALVRPVPLKVAAGGAWTDERTYVVRLWWYETPFATTYTFHFDGDRADRLTVEQRVNVGFGPSEKPTLEGHLSR